MLKTILIALLSFLVLFSQDSNFSLVSQNSPDGNSGTIEKMIVADGSVRIDLDMNRLNGNGARSKVYKSTALEFDVERDSFFNVVVFNDEFRGSLPGSMALIPRNAAALPDKLNASYQQLVLESTAFGGQYELVVRDGQTGFLFFNIEGHEFAYESGAKTLTVEPARILISKEFAVELGRPSDAGSVVGQISFTTTMRTIEITKISDGEVKSKTLPPIGDPLNGTIPGPDVVVGDVIGLAQFGASSGTQVGLAVGTDSCNYGTIDLNWFANPNNDHPVIPQNMYRMSGGTTNDERFEQIGQSNVKHAFTALTQNLCGLGCNGVGGSRLGSGCSDPYSAGLNSGPNLGSRAWINPFSGAYPRNDGATPNNNHTGHTHLGPSHRVLTEINDLVPAMNPGATYYAEAQYVTPHEYAWCQANPTQCNMYNNVSYRRYNVSNSASPFSFAPVGATQRTKAAIVAWTGSTLVEFKPAPGVDGVGMVAYKVTNPSPGVWHYEYAVYNQNLDRGLQSFSVPIGNGVTLSNIGFHAPPQHPGWTGDGTVGNVGFSSTPWTPVEGGGAVTWTTETLTQNPNANAIRWGTMYNFRFDSNRPPQGVDATIGFFKTGNPINIQVQGPTPTAATNVSVSGRVSRSNGQGISFAYVYIIDASNNTRGVLTNSFGYYRFDNVATGGTYTIGALKKGYDFAAQVIQINDHLTNLNFVADSSEDRQNK